MKSTEIHVISESLKNYTGVTIKVTINAPQPYVDILTELNRKKIAEFNSKAQITLKEWSESNE
jgi:hypothetical protein